MEPRKKRLMLIILMVLVILCCSFYNFWQKNAVYHTATSKSVMPTQENVGREQYVVIYVNGGVKQPGVLEIKKDARIIDAINQAGGLLPGADCSTINLAQTVTDGMQIQVPIHLEGKEIPAKEEKGKISINTANKAELDKLPGVGPALAEKIIEYRDLNGPYKELEDLKKVKGVGEAKFKQMKDKISL